MGFKPLRVLMISLGNLDTVSCFAELSKLFSWFAFLAVYVSRERNMQVVNYFLKRLLKFSKAALVFLIQVKIIQITILFAMSLQFFRALLQWRITHICISFVHNTRSTRLLAAQNIFAFEYSCKCFIFSPIFNWSIS